MSIIINILKAAFTGIVSILKTVFIIGFITVYLILELVKWLFTGEQKRVKILSTVLVGLIVATLAIYLPKILLVAVIVLAVVVVGFIIFGYVNIDKSNHESKQENAGSNTENNTNSNTNRNTNTEQSFARKSYQFFAGMTPDQAKKEYHRLMKQYHPDNLGGDLEMSQLVSEEYRRLRAG